ncbi:MAG TPA: hypothetical protein VEL28_20070, partial [Candidatus Binatia bacterium]|nr:hypothetical protein [Candidatus Binatia bacterium]
MAIPNYQNRVRAVWLLLGRPNLGAQGTNAIAAFRRTVVQTIYYGTDGEPRDLNVGEWFKSGTPPHDRDINKLVWKHPGGRGVTFADLWRMHDPNASEPRWMESEFPNDDQANWREPPSPVNDRPDPPPDDEPPPQDWAEVMAAVASMRQTLDECVPMMLEARSHIAELHAEVEALTARLENLRVVGTTSREWGHG